VLELRAGTCGVDDSSVSERAGEVDVNGTIDGLTALLDLAADEDEHLYSGVVLLHEHVADVLA
jgi:hypothetical protein